MKKTIIFFTIILLSSAIISAKPKKSITKPDIEWRSIFINNIKVGYTKTQRIVYTDRIRNIEFSVMKMKIKDKIYNKRLYSEIIETKKGTPISFYTIQTAGDVFQIIKGTVDNKKIIHVTINNNGKIKKFTKKWPKGALLDEGIELLYKNKKMPLYKKYSYLKFSTLSLKASKVEFHYGPKEKVNIGGTIQKLKKVYFTSYDFNIPLKSIAYVTDKDKLKKSIGKIGIFEFIIIPSTEKYALHFDLKKELQLRKYIKSPYRITWIDLNLPIHYTLKLKSDKFQILFPKTTEQSISKMTSNNEIILTVKKVTPDIKTTKKYSGSDKKILRALKAGQHIQSDAKEIIALSKKAIGDAKTQYQKAINIKNFVYNYITKKNLSIAYASALEVYKSREGDCTEHSVLCAALCRAAGIPTRLATGLVYISEFDNSKNIFVPHQWVQVYISNKWISIDPAMKDFSTGHILLNYRYGDEETSFNTLFFYDNVKIMKINSYIHRYKKRTQKKNEKKTSNRNKK